MTDFARRRDAPTNRARNRLVLVLVTLAWALAGCSPGSSSSDDQPEDVAAPDAPNVDAGENQRQQKVIPETSLGRVHRLSTTEYKNTIRDLFAVPVDLEGLFPPENIAHGFTNNSEAQTLTPMVVERYLEAAERVSEAALTEESTAIFEEVEELGLPEGSWDDEPKEGEGLIKTFSGGDKPTLWCGALGYSMALPFSVDSAGTYRFTLPIWWENFTSDFIVDEEKSPVTARVDNKKVTGWQSSTQSVGDLDVLLYTAQHHVEKGAHSLEISLAPQVLSDVEGGVFCVDSLETRGPVDTPVELKSGDGSVLAACDHTTDGVEECAETVITAFGRRAWRRALSTAEVSELVALVSSSVDEGWLFREGLEVALQGILLHPNFVFLIEDSRPAGETNAPGVSAHEMAARLSYFLWSSTPDEKLLDCAESGGLDVGVADDTSPCSVEKQVERMLDDDKAGAIIDDFMIQWLLLGTLDTLTRDPDKFPDFTPEHALSMKEESLRFLRELYDKDLSALNMLDEPFTWVDTNLREIYDLDAGSGSGFERVSLTDNKRGGFLKQAAFLNITSTATRTSPVKRGVYVLERLLCSPPPSPPANVPSLVEEELTAKSVPELMAKHREDPSCASCHALIDPVGLVFENYDAMGRWRDQYPTGAIDPSSTLSTGEALGSVDDLVTYLKDEPRTLRCAVERLFTWAMGRGIATQDEPYLDTLMEELGDDQRSLKALARAIIRNAPFLMRRAQKEKL